MAHIDSETGEIVLRIVYDGLPSAGKTTNVRVLHERLLSGREGELSSPGTTGRATERFDFRGFAGGYLGERKLRCIVLGAPGQVERASRRRFVLEDADAVVFVLDATEPRLDESRAAVRSLCASLGTRDVPIVLQLNKIDAADGEALDAAAIVEALRLSPTTHVVRASAERGEAVTETFLLSMQLATQRVRALYEAGALPRDTRPLTSDALSLAMDVRLREPT